MHDSTTRYSALAIVLHWAIAAAIVGNLGLGWWMHEAIEAPQSQARAVAAFQLHKSIGFTVLVLSLFRLLWRWLHQPPPLPAAMPRWERLAAQATHWAFYALMIGIPLSGWIYVSTQWRGSAPLNVPTLWFGLFEVPHLFDLNEAARATRQALAGVTIEAHELLAWSAAALLLLHVAAALKHQFVNRDAVLGHMIPALDRDAQVPRDRRRTAMLVGGFLAIAAAATTIALALQSTPSGTGAASHSVPVAPSTPEPGAVITSAKGSWAIDPARSELAFAGVHAGAAFRGRFTRWNADLRLDPADATKSHIAATIQTGSAADGVPLHEETLPQTEWFDVANHPEAQFHATHIRPREGGGYDVEGTLTIKGRDLQLAPLTLTIDGNRATIEGRVKIDRRDADLGMESDPDAAWVSREIVVDVRVTATRRSIP